MTIIRISAYKGEGIATFDCGQEELNAFLSKYASQNDRKGIGRTYLGLEGDTLVGFYTLAAGEIDCDDLPPLLAKKLPRYPVPAIRIARLAVAKKAQGTGYGKQLLHSALSKSVAVSSEIGANLVIVDAKPSAVGFYEHFGFVEILKTNGTYALPISTIKEAFE
ncbi:MAG: GNAT family N-acetyltransferase [Erysipelotrichaceae bacterium]|jgi:GNAT superfamily N-acetyltransferase|nr:GNAT family N-acetyltransferase [Erysipelotrichaceae bacterium]